MDKDKPTIEKILKRQEERELSKFGSRDLIITDENEEAAEKDVKKLEIQVKYKKAILTGFMRKPKKGEIFLNLDSNRRTVLHIICALIRADYGYKTIFNVFFNKHLKCCLLIVDRGEEGLKEDVLEALSIIRVEKSRGSKEQRIIAHIKGLNYGWEKEVDQISKFILYDLIAGENPTGKGFYNADRRIPYFFNSEDKTLMDTESDEFYFFVRDRYDIPKKDYDPEVKDRIRAHIYEHEKRIEAHLFAYFDKRTYTLYVSDHDNGIYRLNGEKIEHVDNGADGVYFEFNSDFTPFDVDIENLEAINYFERERETKITLEKKMKLKLGRRKQLGFSWSEFTQSDSYLRRYLIDIANFAETEKNITAVEQKILLVTYFYSLFFESLMTEKPIICFVGLKDSGKSTIGSLIGKILFGEKFQCRHCPDNTRDLNTIIGENYFMVFDNLDHFVKSEIIDALCIAATGGTIERRKLYTDRKIVKIRPHVFLGITTREARFKRDDLISRLILFNTEKITRRIQKEKFYRDVEENRNKIMAEVLLNLNPIIALLKRQKSYSPECTFRVADWETFGRKVNHNLYWAQYFKLIMDVMNEEKDKFALEDDPLFFLLKRRVIDKEEPIIEKSSSELYVSLKEDAESLKMKDYFGKRYKSPVSIGKRIKNVQDELRRVFEVEIRRGSANVTFYSFDMPEEMKEEIEEGKKKEEEERKRKEKEEVRKKLEEVRKRAEEEKRRKKREIRKKKRALPLRRQKKL